MNQRSVIVVWAPTPTTHRLLLGAARGWGPSQHLSGWFCYGVGMFQRLGFLAGRELGLGSFRRASRACPCLVLAELGLQQAGC